MREKFSCENFSGARGANFLRKFRREERASGGDIFKQAKWGAHQTSSITCRAVGAKARVIVLPSSGVMVAGSRAAMS